MQCIRTIIQSYTVMKNYGIFYRGMKRIFFMPKLSFVHLLSHLSDNYSILVPSFFLEKTFGQIFKGLKVSQLAERVISRINWGKKLLKIFKMQSPIFYDRQDCPLGCCLKITTCNYLRKPSHLKIMSNFW